MDEYNNHDINLCCAELGMRGHHPSRCSPPSNTPRNFQGYDGKKKKRNSTIGVVWGGGSENGLFE